MLHPQQPLQVAKVLDVFNYKFSQAEVNYQEMQILKALDGEFLSTSDCLYSRVQIALLLLEPHLDIELFTILKR